MPKPPRAQTPLFVCSGAARPEPASQPTTSLAKPRPGSDPGSDLGPGRRCPRALRVALAWIVLGSLACGLPMPDLNNQDEPRGDSPPKLRPMVCDALRLERAEGAPMERVTLSWQGSQADFINARVLHESGDFMAVVDREQPDQPWALTLPFHPDLFEGGTLQVELSLYQEDGERSVKCAPTSIAVRGIPRAPGTLRQIMARSLELIELRAQSLGESMQTMRQGELHRLPLMLHGPAMAAELWDGQDNAYSVEALLEGRHAEVTLDPEDLARAEAMLAHVRYVQSLEDSLRSQRQINEQLAAQPITFKEVALTESAAALIGGSTGCPLTRVKVPDVLNAQELSRLMVLADLAQKNANAEWKQLFNFALAVTGLVPHPGLALAVAVVQFVMTLEKHLNLAYAQQLPNTLFDGRIRQVTTPLDEGRHETGSWAEYVVMARNKEWDMNAILIDAFIALLPVGDGIKGLKRFEGFKKIQIKDLISPAAKTNVFNGLGLSSGALDKVVKRWTALSACKLPARTWGPFNLSASSFSEVTYSRAIEAQTGPGSRYDYFNVKTTGVGVIRVSPRVGRFPPASNVELGQGVGAVDVRPVEVRLEPGVARLNKGGDLILTARVSGTDDLSVGWDLLRPSPAPGITLTPIEDDAQGHARARLSAAANTQVERVVVRATSLSTQAARGRPGAPARSELGIYTTNSTVLISPTTTCLELGQSLEFKAHVEGEQTYDLAWSATGGSITPRGVFSANKAGRYEVKAALKRDPAVFDRATVVVQRECACAWDALVEGGGVQRWGALSGVLGMYAPGQLELFLEDELGNSVQIKALNGVYGDRDDLDANVRWGMPGQYMATGIFSASKTSTNLFDTLSTLEDGPQLLTIERWEDNHVEGVYQGQISLFGSRLLPPSQRVMGRFNVRFRGYVKDTTNLLGLITSPSCP